eukprot:c18891_g1_i1 orf=64-351(-)
MQHSHTAEIHSHNKLRNQIVDSLRTHRPVYEIYYCTVTIASATHKQVKTLSISRTLCQPMLFSSYHVPITATLKACHSSKIMRLCCEGSRAHGIE